MRIRKVEMFLTSMQLVQPFRTHLETVTERESILLKATDADGFEGWGEVVAFSSPWYTEETIETAWHMLERFFIPAVLELEIERPHDISAALTAWRGNPMAKAGIEMVGWDLFAKRANRSLARYIGGKKIAVEAGVVVGIANPAMMISLIAQRIEEGYKRVKVKIEPGRDFEVINSIREQFPTLPLMADANSAYTLKDMERLKRLDKFNLLMIEQPLAADDIVEHAELQKYISTPICLDESIVSLKDAQNAIKLGSCQVINIKIGRVGGLTNAINIHNLCAKNDIPVWCGGMLETGISRAFNIALASLSHFTIPGDISASSRYWMKDVIKPEVVVENGTIMVPEAPGIGYSINEEYINSLSKRTRTYKR